MKRINTWRRPSFRISIRFRLIYAALGGIILLVFMLCQSGGRVVEADTSIGNNDVHLTLIPAGASPTPSPTPTCPAGFLDRSFGGTGKVTTPIGNGVDQARSVAIQSDGRIVAAGYS